MLTWDDMIAWEAPQTQAMDRGLRTSIARFSAFHIPVLLLLFAGVHMIVLMHADALILGWRPTDMASIALNYYRNGLHFLYPQVNWGGNGQGFVEMEFPAISYLIALLYRIFGVHEWLALVIPMLSGVGLVVVVYSYSRLLFGSAVGFLAGVFTAFSPTLSALTSGLWPDPPMIFLGALGLYVLTLWVKESSPWLFLLGAFGITGAILLKLTALYLGFPVLYLCYSKYGSAWWKQARVWMLAVLILLPPLLWYWYAHHLYVVYHNTFGILSAGFMKFGTTEILTSSGFYLRSLLRLAMYHFTPLVFAALLYGLMLRGFSRPVYVIHVWFAAVALSLLVAARGVLIGHYQYMLPIVPPGVMLAGMGANACLEKLRARFGYLQSPTGLVYVLAAVFVLLVGGIMVTASLWFSRDVYDVQNWENDRKTGLAVRALTNPESLIVVVDGQMDGIPPEQSMTPPNVFYYGDRRGWYISMSWLTVDLIESVRQKGARYVIITANAIPRFASECSRVEKYLSGRYASVLHNQEGIIFDLAVPLPAVNM